MTTGPGEEDRTQEPSSLRHHGDRCRACGLGGRESRGKPGQGGGALSRSGPSPRAGHRGRSLRQRVLSHPGASPDLVATPATAAWTSARRLLVTTARSSCSLSRTPASGGYATCCTDRTATSGMYPIDSRGHQLGCPTLSGGPLGMRQGPSQLSAVPTAERGQATAAARRPPVGRRQYRWGGPRRIVPTSRPRGPLACP